ncbi:hypothetical protein F4009_10115 [Candidatus Poribacteria bacterium]|nr:hypothetical protein [Candidatus Poribacteria bacterium]MYK94329.1 hypothetical protein [Candidatus Poribacteria bacterium]
MTSITNPQTDTDLGAEQKVEPTHFQSVPILDPVFQETYTAHLEKEELSWRGWMPQLPEVECPAKTKKELVNTLTIRLREALQAREDAWDKQLEVDIEAGKLEHLQEDARRAKQAGKRIDL